MSLYDLILILHSKWTLPFILILVNVGLIAVILSTLLLYMVVCTSLIKKLIIQSGELFRTSKEVITQRRKFNVEI